MKTDNKAFLRNERKNKSAKAKFILIIRKVIIRI